MGGVHCGADGGTEGVRAERAANVGRPGGRVGEHFIDGPLDQGARLDQLDITIAATAPVEQHGGRQDQGGRVRKVLARDVRRRPMLRLRDADRVADVDGPAQAQAAGQLGADSFA